VAAADCWSLTMAGVGRAAGGATVAGETTTRAVAGVIEAVETTVEVNVGELPERAKRAAGSGGSEVDYTR
jgi:hypothetical protein